MNKLIMKITPAKGSRAETALKWAVCTAVAALHSWSLTSAPYEASSIAWVFPLLVLAPGLMSMLLLPGEWRHWYRWLAILGLTYSSYAEFIPVTVFIGTLWALHRAWVIERSAPLRGIFSLRRTGKTKTSARTPKTA